MKTQLKISLVTFVAFMLQTTFAQKNQSQASVNLVMDMQPVLQVEFISPQQIDFVFDDKSKYYRGIVHNAATEIRVTSTVSWDMYAVGRSSGKNPNGPAFWDQNASYKSTNNSVANLPLSLLEIKQSNQNKGVYHDQAIYQDYSKEFSKGFRPSASNSLYVSSNGTPTPPTKNGKYLAGHSGSASYLKNGYVPAGSYYSKYSNQSDYHFVIDYRILPGFPAIFPNAFNQDASLAENLITTRTNNTVYAGNSNINPKKSYAEPGYYTMNVQYVILEDQ